MNCVRDVNNKGKVWMTDGPALWYNTGQNMAEEGKMI